LKDWRSEPSFSDAEVIWPISHLMFGDQCWKNRAPMAKGAWARLRKVEELAPKCQIDDTTHHQLAAVAQAYQAALQMSDSTHPDFRDSCADVVEFLWQYKARVDAVLAKVPHGPETPTSAPATALTITNQ
jgi:hypothetical protein